MELEFSCFLMDRSIRETSFATCLKTKTAITKIKRLDTKEDSAGICLREKECKKANFTHLKAYM